MKHCRGDTIAVVCGILALWLMLEFGKHIGRKHNHLPQTLWNHNCTAIGNDTTLCNLGTNELTWWCGCGKSGTNTYPLEYVVTLKPWFTNVPSGTFQGNYRTNYFTNEPIKYRYGTNL